MTGHDLDVTRPMPVPKLGLDIGRVVISAAAPDAEDTSFLGRSLQEAVLTPPSEDMFERLPPIVQHFEGLVWLVSKAREPMQAKTRAWLEHHKFFERTGIPSANLRFCLERREKAVHCRDLCVTHFVDDRMDVLDHLRGIVGRRYLFGPQTHARVPRNVTWIRSWHEMRPSTFPKAGSHGR